ncbi:hypothetical protein CLOP_g2286 [Closterium sp. NIES-67]|nr:hypothetical protein CLOP_g2286 [Closterium sp. NIES-67]
MVPSPGDLDDDVASMLVNITDMHDFKHEVTVEEALTLNQVEKRAREQGRVWWSYEANKGPYWFLEEPPASITGVHLRANLQATIQQATNNLHLHLHHHSPSSSTSTLPSSSSCPAPCSAGGGLSGSGLFTNMAMPAVLKRLVRKGIPPHLRPRVWKAVSGAAKKEAVAPDDYYSSLVEETSWRTTDHTLQIDHDLHRTFPKHPRMDTPESLAALRRVLVAYSFRDSHVGYCQGMNYVAAYLLLVMRSEEDTFWMLATLVENVLYDDCFAEDLFGVHVEQRVLKDLLKKKQPKLASHLDKVGFELSLVTTEWFLCVFAKTFPSETTLRVWDVLFNEGAKVLFRVALALFKMNEAELMTAQHLGDVVEVLNRASSRQFDPDILLQVAFDRLGTMSMSTILKQRKRQKNAVVAALEVRQQQLNAYTSSHGSSGSSRSQENRERDSRESRESREGTSTSMGGSSSSSSSGSGSRETDAANGGRGDGSGSRFKESSSVSGVSAVCVSVSERLESSEGEALQTDEGETIRAHSFSGAFAEGKGTGEEPREGDERGMENRQACGGGSEGAHTSTSNIDKATDASSAAAGTVDFISVPERGPRRNFRSASTSVVFSSSSSMNSASTNHRTLPAGALFRDASAACGSRNSRGRGALGGALKGGVAGGGEGWGGVLEEAERRGGEERGGRQWGEEGFTPPQGLPPRIASHLNLNLNSMSVARMHAAAEAALSAFSAASEVSSVAAASVSLAMGSREAENALTRTNSL